MANPEIAVDLKGVTKVEEKEFSRYSVALVNQIKAADYTYEVIRRMDDVGLLDETLNAVKETDVFRLRRGLCLPCASASSINWIENKRVIGDQDGKLKVGDIYRLLLPHHGRTDIKDQNGDDLPKGWLFATDQGDVYHHAVVAFSKALGIEAEAVSGFRSLNDLRGVVEGGGAAVVSFDNKFVIEQTLKGKDTLVTNTGDKDYILIEGEEGPSFRMFEEGRHAVSLVGFENDQVVLIDSFCLPQMSEENMVVKLDIDKADRYLDYFTGETSRGIIFSKSKQVTNSCDSFKKDIIVPQRVVDEIRSNLVT